jgi:protein-S-isoprenylcysteine O-methyltransferase Ste14
MRRLKELMAVRWTQSKLNQINLTLRVLMNCLLAFIFFGLPLFLSAGTLRFWNAWLFLALFEIPFLIILIYLALKNPTLAEKRLQGNEQEKPQRLIMALLISSAIIMLVVSGLDYREHWSSVPIVVIVISSILVIGGFALLFFVMRENSYASRVVEIQEDQKLIDTGLYGVIRHPMYLAFLIVFLFAAMVLGSWYALIPAFCIPILVTFRIRDEEKRLLAGLKGYDEYTKKVRFRLIPFIW